MGMIADALRKEIEKLKALDKKKKLI